MKNLLIFFVIIFGSLAVKADAQAICVNVSKANTRVGPGTGYETLWEVYKFTPLKKVGMSLSGDWYAARDVDGDVIWISKRLVTDRYRCAVVKSDKVNVRTGAGTSRSLSSLSPAVHYDSFRVLKKSGEWVKVTDEKGDVGWIDKNYLWIQ